MSAISRLHKVLLRERTGLSLRDFACAMHIHKNKLWDWEHNRAQLTADEYARWKHISMEARPWHDLT